MKSQSRGGSHRLLWAFVTALGLAMSSGITSHAAEPASITLYDKDPQHVWNRLATALLAGNSPLNGQPWPWDLLDSPQWFGGDLQEGAVQAKLSALLSEFVTKGPRAESMSALQRAVMQRDLLAIFRSIERVIIFRERTAAERGLLGALAKAIRYVALTQEEIAQLPDNCAAASAAAVETEDHPDHPQPFLPKDLLMENGPWLGLLAESGGVTAPAHFNAFEGRSSFEVRLRIPGGRAAALAYLQTLAEMKEPWVNEPPLHVSRAASMRDANGKAHYFMGKGSEPGPWLNPETPQFPPGTAWALVRRAILAEPNGQPVVSPLIESVQIRVYRTTARGFDVMNAPEVVAKLAAVDSSQCTELSAQVFGEKVETIFEWESRRAQMLGGGAFHLTQPEDLKYAVFPFGINLRDPQRERLVPVTSFCSSCHPGSGIHSVLSRSRGMLLSGPLPVRPPEFYAATRMEIDQVTASAAKNLSTWTLLRWLMGEP